MLFLLFLASALCLCESNKPDEELVTIPVYGGAASVQALVTLKPSPVVVIATHPWGPIGGSMYDPHPATIVRLLSNVGCSTARFNFRGGINRGISSVDDVKAVAAWFTESREGKKPVAPQVLLAGYSYGSLIAAAAASEIPGSIGYVALGPPIDYAWALYLFNGRHLMGMAANSSGKPKLLMIGDSDQFCRISSFNSFVATLPEPKESVVIDGSDHFSLWRHMREKLMTWIMVSFNVCDLNSFASSGAKQTGDAQCVIGT